MKEYKTTEKQRQANLERYYKNKDQILQKAKERYKNVIRPKMIELNKELKVIKEQFKQEKIDIINYIKSTTIKVKDLSPEEFRLYRNQCNRKWYQNHKDEINMKRRNKK